VSICHIRTKNERLYYLFFLTKTIFSVNSLVGTQTGLFKVSAIGFDFSLESRRRRDLIQPGRKMSDSMTSATSNATLNSDTNESGNQVPALINDPGFNVYLIYQKEVCFILKSTSQSQKKMTEILKFL
jgi:hypothetical protein